MRTLPELLVLRHGETEWNRAGRFQGASDSALTERGRAQALALGRLLGMRGVSPRTHDALTSPQGRARETARIALGPLGFAPADDPRLAEIRIGAWTGLDRAEIAARWPGPPDEPVLAFYRRCPGGETLEEVAARVGGVLAGAARPLVIVTHGITLRVLCALALGGSVEDAEAVRVPQGCLARVAEGRLQVLGPEGLPPRAAAGSPGATGG